MGHEHWGQKPVKKFQTELKQFWMKEKKHACCCKFIHSLITCGIKWKIELPVKEPTASPIIAVRMYL